MTWLGICHASESSAPIRKGRAGLKEFPTQFHDSYTILSTQRRVLCILKGGGGGCRYLDISVGGGGGRVCGESVILASPQVAASGFYTPPQMGNLSFWRPPNDSFRVFYPLLMGFLPFWDPQMAVSGCYNPPPPHRWDFCQSGVPQMTVSGCFTPP